MTRLSLNERSTTHGSRFWCARVLVPVRGVSKGSPNNTRGGNVLKNKLKKLKSKSWNIWKFNKKITKYFACTRMWYLKVCFRIQTFLWNPSIVFTLTRARFILSAHRHHRAGKRQRSSTVRFHHPFARRTISPLSSSFVLAWTVGTLRILTNKKLPFQNRRNACSRSRTLDFRDGTIAQSQSL